MPKWPKSNRSQTKMATNRNGRWFVVLPFCGHFGLLSFRFAAISICGHLRLGFWPFPFCGNFGLWSLRFAAISICGHLRITAATWYFLDGIVCGLNYFSSICPLLTKSMPVDLLNAIFQQRFCADSPNLQRSCIMALVYVILEKKMH